MDSKLAISGFSHIFYPYYDFKRRTTKPSLAYVFKVDEFTENPDGEKVLMDTHTVVASVNPGRDYASFWCGDKLLEGRLKGDKLAERLDVMGYGGPSVLDSIRDAIPPKAEPDHGCDFWALYRKGEDCRHVAYVKAMVDSGPAGQYAIEELVRAVNSAPDERPQLLVSNHAVAGLQMLLGVADGLDELLFTEAIEESDDTLPWYATPEGMVEHLAFRSPVLLEGNKGGGKTTMARALAEQREALLVEVQGNESLEAGDLLGHFVPAKKDLVWKDGRLSQAFRLAGKGNKVVLLLDELLRIPQKQLSVLLAALSPFKGQYTLATGRMIDVEDGVGVEETLQCPVENLAVVATTNMGMQYAVDNIDPALADRFVPIRVDTTLAKVKAAIGEACDARGFADAVRDKLVTFFSKMEELYANRNIAEEPSLRVLTRCVESAQDAKDVPHLVRAHFPLWVARTSTGAPDPKQVDILDGVLKRVFK